MWSRTLSWFVLGYCLLWAGCVDGVARNALYPFGTDHGDTRLPIGDDISSSEIPLSTPIAYFEGYYRGVYVNGNGHLSFETDIPTYKSDLIIPVGFKVIAPLFADVDTSLSGNVYYRETQDPSLLRKASEEIRKHFPAGRRFQATGIFVATWDDVGYYREQYDKTNTFQVVVASDGADSYVFFNYLDDGINWVRGQGKTSPVTQDVPAQAGFDSGDGRRYYTLPGSGLKEVENMDVWSNVGVGGVWLFRVGNLGGDNIQTADSRPSEGNPPEVEPAAQTCAGGGDQTCNANARCQDASIGFCCQCQAPYYGNGISCLEPNSPQRVNGKVSGTVNGQAINNVDLHAYVVTNDGRAYTAMSRLDASIGSPMQSLYTIGGIMGWLFAVPNSNRARNGYMITGGDFNRTAEVRFIPGGEAISVRQSFVGQDVLGYMRVTTQINGNVPRVSPDAKYTVDDFMEQYRRTAPGVIKSVSTNTYRVDGVAHRFSVDQTINYKECSGRPATEPDVLSLSINRNFLVYGDREQIVRFAMTNKIAASTGSDPCQENNCDPNARCTAEDSTYRCECEDGYYGDGRRCEDVDECAQNTHGCDQNAQCVNQRGTYECHCDPGFRGDGFTCSRDLTCSDLTCDINARCVYDSEQGRPRCECNAGYSGDGVRCQIVEFGCNEANNCDENAMCIYDPDERRYRCECDEGFSGDGYTCSDTGEQPCNVINNCARNAQCRYDSVSRGDSPSRGYSCQCNQGYSGDGYVCELDSCNVVNNCDHNARCLYDADSGRYSCVCNPGYSGDGSRCEEEGCDLRNDCHSYARCVYDAYSGRYSCVCNDGFVGDGKDCRRATDCQRDPNICDRNARCTRRERDYICVCNPGYSGDGTRCTTTVTGQNSYLLYAQGMSIMSLPFRPTDDNPGQQVLYIPGQTGIGIDVDCYARYFYWTDVSGKLISRARLDGTDSEVILKGLGSPEGVAVDWVAKNIYWTDSAFDRIEVSKIDGTSRKALFDRDLVNPRAIAVDPTRGMLFWTDWNRASPRIESAHMDGSNRQLLVSENLGLPNGLTINFDTNQVCWADAGTMHIECVDYEGRGRRAVYTLASYPFGLAYSNNIFYWTDWDMKSLPSISQQGGETNEPLDLAVGGNGRLYGIATVKNQCPAGSNACVLNNGGCRFLCLPTPNGGRTCVCPDDVPEDECNRINLVV